MKLHPRGRNVTLTEPIPQMVDRWLEDNPDVDRERFREPLIRLLETWGEGFEPGSDDGTRLRAYFSWIADLVDDKHTIVLTPSRYAELMRAVEWHEAVSKKSKLPRRGR